MHSDVKKQPNKPLLFFSSSPQLHFSMSCEEKQKLLFLTSAGLPDGLILLCVPCTWVQSEAGECVALGFNVPVSFKDSPVLLCKLLRHFHVLCYLSWCLTCISSAVFKTDMFPARSYPTTFLFSLGQAGTGDTWLIHCLLFFEGTLQTSVLYLRFRFSVQVPFSPRLHNNLLTDEALSCTHLSLILGTVGNSPRI